MRSGSLAERAVTVSERLGRDFSLGDFSNQEITSPQNSFCFLVEDGFGAVVNQGIVAEQLEVRLNRAGQHAKWKRNKGSVVLPRIELPFDRHQTRAFSS
jgi:hypothetical protein